MSDPVPSAVDGVAPREFSFTAYGELRLHDWAARAYAAGADRDLFIMVANQAAALGLSAFDGRTQGLQWHPIEAGDRFRSPERSSRPVFDCVFQSDAELPLQSAGLVLQQAVDRIGTLELERLDVLVATNSPDPRRFVDGREWFEFDDLSAMVPGRISVSGATGGLVEKVAPWLGATVEFDRAVDNGWEVRLRSASLDFLAWVSGVLAWARADDKALVRFGFGQDPGRQASSS
ncbi:hypothetical protein ACQPXM_08045 [Kribbella sp. CA-253562]|uniref:hypothetical protein n=1 Tax=Kribbella sp. CA-253562 TaxID=3239942 RepID=UPI003D8C29C5